jgi:hypothetical protein
MSGYGISTGTVKVAKLIVMETGTYNPLYHRPFQANITADTLGALAGRVHGGAGTSFGGPTNDITPGLLSGISSQILTPQAAPQSNIVVPGGWGERRLRWQMELHYIGNTGYTYVYYLQGWTSYSGFTQNMGRFVLDDKMDFYINSALKVNRQEIWTPQGMMVKDVVVDNLQVLSTMSMDGNQAQNACSLRPVDMLTALQTNAIRQTMSAYGHGNNFEDPRLHLHTQPRLSKRSGNVSSNYLAEITSGYQHACRLSEFGQGDDNIIDRTKQDLYVDDLTHHPIFRAIQRAQQGYNGSVFRLGEMALLDPNLPNVTSFLNIGNTEKARLHQAGQTEAWHAPTRESVAATFLSNAIPALMMECFIIKANFFASNNTIGAVPYVKFHESGESLKTLSSTMDLQMAAETFIRRLQKEVLFDLSYGNQDIYDITCAVDVFGHTLITVSFNNQPAVPFGTPSFCDALMSPVVSTDMSVLHHNAESMSSIFNYIAPQKSTIPTVNTGI